MPVLKTAQILDRLRCPSCGYGLGQKNGRLFCASEACEQSAKPFLMLGGQPVLVDFKTSLFQRVTYAGGATPITRPLGLAGQLLDRFRENLYGENRPAEAKAAEVIAQLKDKPDALLLVVGGGTAGSGTRQLYSAPDLKIIGLDVFPTDLTTMVADAHRLPFADESMDAVWIQAVLEHVLDPRLCVAEIHRVLKPDGLIYADTPFMQQVHGGPFDFHRFSLNGHRWLMRDFVQLDAGTVGGAGVSLLWALRYFLLSFGLPNKLATALTLPFFWLRSFDRITSLNGNADAANGVYFLGRKSSVPMTPKEIVQYYHDMRMDPRKRAAAPLASISPVTARR